MAINKPRIAGEPAVDAWSVPDRQFYPRWVGPLERETRLDTETGTVIYEDVLEPTREGLLAFELRVDGRNRICIIHVAVEIDGELTWKRAAQVPAIINQYTGKPYDPIYD